MCVEVNGWSTKSDARATCAMSIRVEFRNGIDLRAEIIIDHFSTLMSFFS